MFDSWVSLLTDVGNWIYILVFFAALGEILLGIGFIFPGSLIVLFVSFFGVQNNLSLLLIAFFAFSGSFLGSSLNYFIGHRYILRLHSGENLFGKSSFFRKVLKIVEKNLFKALILGRFTPGIKELAPFIAGGGKVTFWKFLIYNFLGNILWVILFVGVPYLFSYSFAISQLVISRVTYFFLILLSIFFVFGVLQYIILEYGKISIQLFLRTLKIMRSIFLSDQSTQALLAKYPNIIKWIKNRFHRNDFTGIPLTILSILMGYTFVAFGGFLEDALTSNIIKGLDIRLEAFFRAVQDPILVEIFLWITSLCRPAIIFVFASTIAIYFYKRGRKNELYSFLIGLGGTYILSSMLKIFFHHPRPLSPVYLESSYSFPSMHASIAVIFYGFLFYLLIDSEKKWKLKTWYASGGFVTILSIGFSRLYLSEHYLSDVLGGFFIGFIWLLFAIGLRQYLNYSKLYKIQKKKNNPFHIIGIFSCLSLFFIAYNSLFPYTLIDYSVAKDEINIKSLNDIFPQENLKYTQTFLGENAENIHFIFLAGDDAVVDTAFWKAGWKSSDLYNWDSFKKTLGNILFQTPYDTAPITPLFWNNTTQSRAYQLLPDIKDLRFRHHIRIWKTNYMYENKYIYVGVGVLDNGLKWNIIHKIDPDINTEREYIYTSLENAGVIQEAKKIDFVSAYQAKNVFGDIFISDGKLYQITLEVNEKK